LVDVSIQTVNGGRVPTYAHDGDAGADAYANDVMTINPGETVKVPLGIKIAVPQGFEVQVRPKSGLAANFGLTILNTPGTIDSNYRGEIIALVYNTSSVPYDVKLHQKICQLVVNEVPQVNIVVVDELSTTTRGEGKFGSTGLK
jgi:dUTP pyrophosphatase